MVLLGSKCALATAHHLQSDGQTERMIQELLRLLRTYASKQQDQWERLLPLFETAINTSVCAITGYAPRQALLAFPIRLPISWEGVDREPECDPENRKRNTGLQEGQFKDPWVRQMAEGLQMIHQRMRQHQAAQVQKTKERHDAKVRSWRPSAGDLVLLSTRSYEPLSVGSPKQRERFAGPYVIGRSVHPNAYELKGLPPNVPKTQNVEYLKPFYPNIAKFGERPQPQYAQPTEVEGRVEWEVEAILAHRVTRLGLKYQIRWKDSPQTQWLWEWSLRNCLELLIEYHEKEGIPISTFIQLRQKEQRDDITSLSVENEDDEGTQLDPTTQSLDPRTAPAETSAEQTRQEQKGPQEQEKTPKQKPEAQTHTPSDRTLRRIARERQKTA